MSRRSHKSPPAKAWIGLENLIKLTDAADVPLCGGAFTIAAEVIGAFSAARDLPQAYRRVIEAVSTHSDTLWEFMESMSSEYIRESDEPSACLARTAIDDFKEQLDKAYATVQTRLMASRLKRALLYNSMKEDVEECRQGVHAAHVRFQDAVRHVLVSQSRTTAANNASIHHLASQVDRENRPNPFNITGAASSTPSEFAHYLLMTLQVPLRPGDLKILSKVPRYLQRGPDNFWKDTYVAEVQSKPATVKVYYDRSGGEAAFRREVELLGRNVSSHLPQVVGYSDESVPPYIVLGPRFFVPFKTALGNVCTSKTKEAAICDVWRMLLDLKEAIIFIVENNPTLSYKHMKDAIKRTRVDENGKVVLAPPHDLGKLQMWFILGEDTEGIDFVTRSWFTQFSRRVEFRPIRVFAYALAYIGDSSAVMAIPRSELADPKKAVARLMRWWPTEWWKREMFWPEEDTPRWPRFADVGVFEPGPRGLPIWRTLTSIGHLLESFVFCTRNMKWDNDYERVEEYIFRKTVFVPGQAAPAYRGDWIQDQDEYVPNGGRVIKFTYMHWIPRSRDAEYLYFARNAGLIAQHYGVKPWDLVFVTKRVSTCQITLPASIIQSLTRPLYVYYYFVDGVSPFFHFSYRDQPYKDADTAIAMDLAGRLDLDFTPPAPVLIHDHPLQSQFLQLEPDEFEEPSDPGHPYTFKELKVRPPLPDIYESADIEGTTCYQYPYGRRPPRWTP